MNLSRYFLSDVVCGIPPTIAHSSYDNPSRYFVNFNLTFTCDSGYSIKSSSSAQTTFTCAATNRCDAQWIPTSTEECESKIYLNDIF